MPRPSAIVTALTTLALCIGCSDQEKESQRNTSDTPKGGPGESMAVGKELRLETGMAYESAMKIIQRSGATEFACSYRYSIPKDAEVHRYAWYTLGNGMSIAVSGTGYKDKELTLTRLAVCNSTMLFCCKGESWFELDKIAVDRGKAALTWMPNTGDKTRHLLYVGMRMDDAEETLGASRFTGAPVSKEILEGVRRPEVWRRYRLSGSDLLLRFSGGGEGSSMVRQLVVSGHKPAKGIEGGEDFWIESEVVDLSNPLKEGWHWAFAGKWAWTPSEDPESHLQGAGQRR